MVTSLSPPLDREQLAGGAGVFPGAWKIHSTSSWAQRTRPDRLGPLPHCTSLRSPLVPDKRKDKDKNFH